MAGGLRDLLDADPDALAPIAAAWEGRVFRAWYARPLLILASFRFLALADHDHPLGPEVLLNAEASDLETRLREALADPALAAVLAVRSVQTNEPTRAIGWGLVASILDLPEGGWDLVDLGCSAGLNLVADRVPINWRVDRNTLGSLDFPSPWTRLGLDAAPVDLTSAEALRWLRSCIWPGDRARMERFERSVGTHLRWRGKSPPPEVRRFVIGPDVLDDTLLDAIDDAFPGARPTVVFSSVVADYLSPEAAGALAAQTERWLSGGRDRVRVSLEPAPALNGQESPLGPMALDLTLHDGAGLQRYRLARMGYHPTQCNTDPHAVGRLRAAWSRA